VKAGPCVTAKGIFVGDSGIILVWVFLSKVRNRFCHREIFSGARRCRYDRWSVVPNACSARFPDQRGRDWRAARSRATFHEPGTPLIEVMASDAH